MRLSAWAMLMLLMLWLLAAPVLSACSAEGGISILPPPEGGETGTTQVDANIGLILLAVVAIVAIAAAGLRR